MLLYEWDEDKNAANKRKHGISFETAAKVFNDANWVLIEDRVDEGGEQRWHAIGLVGSTALVVVHVYRKEQEQDNAKEVVRIISAREADQRERRSYLQQAVE